MFEECPTDFVLVKLHRTTHVEELVGPHANLDNVDAPAEVSPRDPAEPTESDIKKIDIRITMLDIERFGYSDDCPRCAELDARWEIQPPSHRSV